MKALLIVDIQNDFLEEGALGVTGGNKIIDLINQLQDQFELIVASKDWHPKNHISFASTHQKQVFDVVTVDGEPQVLWPPHCIQDTHGAEFSPKLNVERIEKVFFKGVDPLTDSYSAFFDNKRERQTGLALYLKLRKVDEIFIVGLTTDYCVRYSALDAVSLGLKVTVYLDACVGVNLHPGDEEKALSEMERAGVKLQISPQSSKSRSF
jgi:nicotinamidase/pyrazinamidase